MSALSRALPLLLAAAALLAGGCRTSGKYVWVDDLPLAPADGDYAIVPGDVLSVSVLHEEPLTTKVKVQPDGKISVPFLADVPAAGKSPAALARELQAGLAAHLKGPLVTVILESAKPYEISVMGAVHRPGLYNLEPGAGVLHALASAGGLNDYAYPDEIFVLRQAPQPARIRLRYEALSRAEGKAAQFRLQRGDVVVVE